MVLVSIVTAAICASALPHSSAPVVMVIDWFAIIVPLKTLPVLSVAELPTAPEDIPQLSVVAEYDLAVRGGGLIKPLKTKPRATGTNDRRVRNEAESLNRRPSNSPPICSSSSWNLLLH